MARFRKNCANCGHGFLVSTADASLKGAMTFCKKKCAIEYHGQSWKPGLFQQRTKPMSLEEKLRFAESM